MFYLVSTQNAHPLNFEFRVKKGEGVLFLLILATTARPYPNPTLFFTLYKKEKQITNPKEVVIYLKQVTV